MDTSSVIDFPKPKKRPFFFTSFVSTIDGKIIVKKKGYWPIGSKNDYEYFTYLRAHADAIIDAKNTALMFGGQTIATINGAKFRKIRERLGKSGVPDYLVITSSPDEELAGVLQNSYDYKTTILTVENASVSQDIEKVAKIKYVSHMDSSHSHRTTNKMRVSVPQIIQYCNDQGYEYVFIDGGPSLIAQFLESNSLDEVHLTIAPKIFGSEKDMTLTMTEGILFPKDKIPLFKLISFRQIEDEMFLRYRSL